MLSGVTGTFSSQLNAWPCNVSNLEEHRWLNTESYDGKADQTFHLIIVHQQLFSNHDKWRRKQICYYRVKTNMVDLPAFFSCISIAAIISVHAFDIDNVEMTWFSQVVFSSSKPMSFAKVIISNTCASRNIICSTNGCEIRVQDGTCRYWETIQMIGIKCVSTLPVYA